MKFAEYRSGWGIFQRTGIAKRMGWKNDLEAALWLEQDMRGTGDPIGYRHTLFTIGWRKSGSPYYDVYPSIIKMLAKINLGFPGTMVRKPSGLDHLYIRLPEDGKHYLRDETTVVRGLFLSFQPVNREPGMDMLEDGLVVGIDIGETTSVGGDVNDDFPIFTLRIFPLDERNVEDTLFGLPVHPSTHAGMQIAKDLMLRCMRTAIAVCMLQDDPEILEPQVLGRDADKTISEALIDKARRRGKFGFSVGRHVEMIPHIRRPHPALVWTGKGRSVPKIVFRKGSVIHRKVVEQIPTGKGE